VIDHEATEALLAGYVLGSLSGGDAVEVDRLLTEHVPECGDCRATLDAFQGLTGELGMVARPLTPPETLLPRLQRSLDGSRRRGLPAWSPTRLVAAAAAAVLAVGVVGLAVTRSGGGAEQLLSQADLVQVRTIASRADATVTPVGPASEVVAPGLEELYLMGTDVPAAEVGFTYRLWAVNSEGATWIGDFVPVSGTVVLRIEVDPSTVDRLLVTLEPSGSEPGEPGEAAWAAA